MYSRACSSAILATSIFRRICSIAVEPVSLLLIQFSLRERERFVQRLTGQSSGYESQAANRAHKPKQQRTCSQLSANDRVFFSS
jgi:hypothetical protein